VGPPDSVRVSRVPTYLGYLQILSTFHLRDFHPLWLNFPEHSVMHQSIIKGPATPNRKRFGLDSSAFARRYLRNHYYFLFLRVLRCFTSPGITLKLYFIQTPVTEHYPCRVPPFGNLRIIACLPLPEAYRSLPRPSSSADAKASIVCPYTLGQ
jgi:hypothetical protein